MSKPKNIHGILVSYEEGFFAGRHDMYAFVPVEKLELFRVKLDRSESIRKDVKLRILAYRPETTHTLKVISVNVFPEDEIAAAAIIAALGFKVYKKVYK